MKKIINGKMYNTGTATFLGRCLSNDGDWMHRCLEKLYRKTTGEYFLYGEGGPATAYAEQDGDNSWSAGTGIRLLSESEAHEWAEENLSTDEYIAAFGTPEE